MGIVLSIIIESLAVFIVQQYLPGVSVDHWLTAIMVAVVLGIVNIVLKPIIRFITLPLTILTLGLFSLVINAALVLLVAQVVDGFSVDGFFPALLFSLILSVLSALLHAFFD